MNQIASEFVAARTLSEASVPVTYKAATLRGLDIFYREAGSRDAQTVLLLHGLLLPIATSLRCHCGMPTYRTN